jgi:hypothetical protein
MTPVLTLHTDEGRTWFRPGEVIRGEASWQLEEEAEAVEIRLFWYTSGKGTRDVEVVDSLRTASAGPSGARSFSLRAPDGPYSFSGTLITLAWAIELVVDPGGATERLDLVIGPRPVEVELPEPVDD